MSIFVVYLIRVAHIVCHFQYANREQLVIFVAKDSFLFKINLIYYMFNTFIKWQGIEFSGIDQLHMRYLMFSSPMEVFSRGCV